MPEKSEKLQSNLQHLGFGLKRAHSAGQKRALQFCLPEKSEKLQFNLQHLGFGLKRLHSGGQKRALQFCLLEESEKLQSNLQHPISKEGLVENFANGRVALLNDGVPIISVV